MALVPPLLAAASLAAAAPHAVLSAERPVSDPIPAGDVRFTADSEVPVIARRKADGVMFVVALPATTPVARGRWPYADWWTADLNHDGVTDLVGLSGRTIMLGRGRRGGGWRAPMRWGTVPRGFAVIDVTSVGEEQYQGQDGVVVRNPRTGEVRTVENGAVEWMGSWPRGMSYVLAEVDEDEAADAVGYDRTRGIVRVAYNDLVRFRASRKRWHVPPGAELIAGDVDGDSLADLVFRPRGSAEVSVRRGLRVANPDIIDFRFARPVRAGRWPRPLALTTIVPFEGLFARDPGTGRVVAASFRLRR